MEGLMRRHLKPGLALLVALVALAAPAIRQAPAAVAASPDGAVTWTVDHNKKTIEVLARLQIYSGCSGDPFGGSSQRARACDLPRSMLGGPTQFLADKIKRSIERIWNKPYQFRCYELKFQVDVKLGGDPGDVDSDRIGIRIDPSPAGIRSWVHTTTNDTARWQSDDPADRLTPDNGSDHVTTWSENSTAHAFAHEFGHILGLHDAYHDVPDEFVPGELVSEPLPGAPIDLMSTGVRNSISQETIDRVVKRNIPQMKDTDGKPVTDKDLHCDYEGDFVGHYVSKFLKATTTTDITLEAVLALDDASKALTAEPDARSTYRYDFHATGGNKNAGSDCGNCPPEPPCTSHGEGTLEDVANFQQGTTEGVITVKGAVGDDTLLVTIAIPTSCGGKDLGYFPLLCGDSDGLHAKLDGDSTYNIESTCHADTSRLGLVNIVDGHVAGTLEPLDTPFPTQ